MRRNDRTSTAPPEVSVVIPMYNAASTIGAQLEALACQGFEGSWELVVADNGSSDGSGDVVAAFADRLPLRIVDASGGRGASYARNVGAASATSPLLLYCDADDVVTPHWIASMVTAAQHFDVVGGWRDESRLNPDTRESLKPDGLPVSLGFLPWAYGSNCAVRSDVLRRIGGWGNSYTHGGDDVDFSWRAQLAGYRLGFAEESVILYRQREGSWALFRQQFDFGATTPMLYKHYRDAGARALSVVEVVRAHVWILSRSPYLFLSARLRRRWLRMAAHRVGCLWGSIRNRVWCL